MISRASFAALLVGLLVSTAQNSAMAEDLPLYDVDGETIRLPPIPGLDIQSEHVSKILYLNRCADGCIITPGPNDARFNTSRIVAGTSQITPWRHGDTSWALLVDCVKEMYAPYDVEVTDVDPGPNIFHHEAIVAGRYQEIGREEPAGGVAPSQCNPANNVISFTFANGYGNDPINICHTVGQESAHSYGLEHAMDCSDPMTYLSPCGRQFFRNRTTPCGEFEALDQCQCGGTAQNSHNWLISVLGENPVALAGPNIDIQLPTESTTINNGFKVAATASHVRGIGIVELLLNGTSYGTQQSNGDPNAAYWFDTPADLPDGIIDVEIRATNDIGTEASAMITVQKGSPCTSAATCYPGQSCDQGRCISPQAMGELGDPCTADSQCVDNTCAVIGDEGYCSELCFPTSTENTCEDGYECRATNGSSGLCWPVAESGGCGCSSTRGTNPLGASLLLLLICAFPWLWRRRNRSF
jgi:hypothetical protein